MFNENRAFEWVEDLYEVGPVAPLPEVPLAADLSPLKVLTRHLLDKGDAVSDSPSPMADTVPGGPSTTATLAMGGSVDVVIETLGDHDWYSVSLTAGQTYIFTTQSISGSNPDTFLNLRNGTGTVVASDDDGGDTTYSLITYTATTTGTFYIDAGTFNDESTGSYHLSAIAVPATGADSVLATTATTATLAVTGGIAGNIETASDHDWYRITLTAGETYVFRTGGVVADGTVDTTLTLRDAAGTQLLTNDDAGEGAYSAVRFTATTSGTYYLDVGAFGSTTGQYTLTAFTTPPLTLYTNDQIANQLTNGYWGGSSHHFNIAPGGTITFNVTALTAPGQTLAREAFNLWTDVTGINFSEITTAAQITLDDNQTGAFANASFSNGITTSGTVNVGTAWLTSYGTSLNSYSFQTYIHEIGHVLGLGHAGNYNGSASYATDALYQNDSWATTIMSYFSQTENSYTQGLGYTQQFDVTPMVADGVATTALYGANTLTRTGNTTYGFNNTSGRAVYDATANPSVGYTIYDSGGIDTLDYSGFSQNQDINLNAETFSSVGTRVGNVSIARGVVIENAIGGSGNDRITGNNADNVLTGGNGNDILQGNDGNDTLDGGSGSNELYGGAGNDRLIVGAGSSGTIVDGGTASDTLVVTGSVTLGGLSNIEAVELQSGATLTLTGSQFGTGLPVGTVLSGTGTITVNMTPDQFLFGSTLSVAGGSSIAVVFNGSSGNDYVKAVSQATNTMLGGDGDDFLRGGQLADVIDGGAGGDKITGFGGADTLTGGSGADQFRYLGQSDSGLGANADHITDFAVGIDRLNFSLFDLDPNVADLQNPGFSFLGGSAFHGTGAAEIRYESSGADMVVQVDVNGDGVVDMAIYLNGLSGATLTSADFML
jgi:hypothetical protein